MHFSYLFICESFFDTHKFEKVCLKIEFSIWNEKSPKLKFFFQFGFDFFFQIATNKLRWNFSFFRKVDFSFQKNWIFLVDFNCVHKLIFVEYFPLLFEFQVSFCLIFKFCVCLILLEMKFFWGGLFCGLDTFFFGSCSFWNGNTLFAFLFFIKVWLWISFLPLYTMPCCYIKELLSVEFLFNAEIFCFVFSKIARIAILEFVIFFVGHFVCFRLFFA